MTPELPAFDAGIAAERERIADIMALEEARGREGAALVMALGGELSRDAIRSILVLSEAGPIGTFNTRCRVPEHLKLVALNIGA